MPATSTLTLEFYDGARQPLEGADVFLSVFDGRGVRRLARQVRASQIALTIDIPEDPIANNFRICVSSKGCHDAGILGLQLTTEPQTVRLMLIRKSARPVFSDAAATLREARWKELAGILAPQSGKLASLQSSDPPLAACLWNVLEALRVSRISPGNGQRDATALSFLKVIDLAPAPEKARTNKITGLQRDRILVRVDAALLDRLKRIAADAAVAPAPSILHGKDGESFKENRFQEANLQFTFFADKNDGTLYADLDMDYFRDVGSHLLLEVIPNSIGGFLHLPNSKTDPLKIYAMRWMAGANQGESFDPPYSLS